jgi:hypothetical protein
MAAGQLFLRMVAPAFYNSLHSKWAVSFWCFLSGFVFTISAFSLFKTAGATCSIFAVPILWLALKWAPQQEEQHSHEPSKPAWLEMGLLAVAATLLLWIFPENIAIQKDSYFYLKIAESLQRGGDENMHHVANFLSPLFSGIEPYHYFEHWLTAFIIQCTNTFIPSIFIQQYAVPAILLSGMVSGLYLLMAMIAHEGMGWKAKLFCWSLLLITPAIDQVFPSLLHLFVNKFEGNALQRPNFRIVYLGMVAVAYFLNRPKPTLTSAVLMCLLIGIFTFKFMVLAIPSCVLILWWEHRQKSDSLFLQAMVAVLTITVCYFLFYYLLRNNQLPTLYTRNAGELFFETIKHYRFLAFAFLGSLIQLLIGIALLLLPLWLSKRKGALPLIGKTAKQNQLLLAIGLAGMIAARMGEFIENGYQFLFVTHIVCTFFCWWVVARYAKQQQLPKVFLGMAIFFASTFVAFHLLPAATRGNAFVKNLTSLHTPYSASYLGKLQKNLQTLPMKRGIFIADSLYYQQQFYAQRNPNVYFLPATYLMAHHTNYLETIAIFDSSHLVSGYLTFSQRNYLENAINRSVWQNYKRQNPGIATDLLLLQFVKQHQIQFLMATKNAQVPTALLKMATMAVKDEATGEQYISLASQ